MSEEYCKHGMPKRFCDYCRFPPGQAVRKVRRVAAGSYQTVGEFAPPKVQMVVIKSKPKGRVEYNELSRQTRRVHISGHPHVHILKNIIELCPNLEVIQVQPKKFRWITASTMKFCRDHGVKVEAGLVNPAASLAWRLDPMRGIDRDQWNFMHGLNAMQREKFAELVKFGFEVAQMVARYFCLGGEKVCSLSDLAREFGLSVRTSAAMSAYIRGVLGYLGMDIELNEHSIATCRILNAKVLKLRQIEEDKNTLVRLCERLEIKRIPTNFPLSRLDILEAVLLARNNGRKELLEYRQKFRRNYDMVMFRLGITDYKYHTLEDAGAKFGVNTRERVRQIEAKFLSAIGISED